MLSHFRCSCGKCSTTLLQNPNECLCCQDIEQCVESLSDKWVLEDLQTAPECITLHPAFGTVCLDRWLLRLAAGKYTTIDKKRYLQTTFWRHLFQRRIFIFSFGGVDTYLGGGCCLLWSGPGGNARKGQGKSLTKFVF